MRFVKTKQLLSLKAGLLLTACAVALGAGAQDKYQLRFNGRSSSVNSSGVESTKVITEKTLVRDWSRRAGVTNSNNLVLALHRNVDSRGDAIEVVDRKTGDTITTVAPLFFTESAVSSSGKGTVEKRFAYVYNLYHAEFSRGTAILNENTSIKNGKTNRFLVSADMQWYEVPEGTNGLRIDSGTFKTLKKLK